MRMTFFGHVGFFVETAGGSVLCDPWFTPAYFGSWFPFPRNDRLDPAPFRTPDFLYISHLHRDHFDPEWLARTRRQEATCFAPRVRRAVPRARAARARLRALRTTRTGSRSISDAGCTATILRVHRAGRRAARRLPDRARRRHRPRVEPERCPARRSRRVARPRAVRRADRPVLGRDLVSDRVRLPARAETRLATRQARQPDGPRPAVHRVGRRRARVPVCGAARVPRRRPVRVQRLRPRSREHLPRPDRVPRDVCARPGSTPASWSCPGRSSISTAGDVQGHAARDRRRSRCAPFTDKRAYLDEYRRDWREWLAAEHGVVVARSRAISSASSRSGSSRCCSGRRSRRRASPATSCSTSASPTRTCASTSSSRRCGVWRGEPYVYKADVDRRLRRGVDRTPRRGLGELAVPVVPVRRPPSRPRELQRVRHDVLQGAVAGTDRVRRALLSRRGASAPTSSSSATAGASSVGARTARPTSPASARSPTACSRAACTTGSSTSRPARASRATTAICAVKDRRVSGPEDAGRRPHSAGSGR